MKGQQLTLHTQSTGIDELSLQVFQYVVLLVIGYTPVLIMLRDERMEHGKTAVHVHLRISSLSSTDLSSLMSIVVRNGNCCVGV